MTEGYSEPAETDQYRHNDPAATWQPPGGEQPSAEWEHEPAHSGAGEQAGDASGPLPFVPPTAPAPEAEPYQRAESYQAPAADPTQSMSPPPGGPRNQSTHPTDQMTPVNGPYAQGNYPPQGQQHPVPIYTDPTASGPSPSGGHPSGPQHIDPAGMYPPQQAPHPYATQGQAQYGQPDDLGRRTQQAAHDLSSAKLLKTVKREPQSGWRKAVFMASGRTLNFGESAADAHRRELITRINQPLRGCYKIAMLSLKGGVGKTTTTTTLGSTFASLRGDRVIAVDANPDRGTLSQKIPLETTATVRHLLRDANRITRYSDVRAYTSQGPSRLEVLASEQDPAVSEAFSESDYRRTIDLLEHFYNIVLTDCGTGLMHSAMKGVLDIADSLVVVSSASIDGARSASATLDWLDAHGYRDLVGRSVAVINSVRPKSGKVHLDRLQQHFAARCRSVCQIPFDPHLEEGAEIELDRLSPDTRLALLQLASTVADDFPHDGNRR
ncbi:MAG: AAA family ATPase [Sciscionella sp.]